MSKNFEKLFKAIDLIREKHPERKLQGESKDNKQPCITGIIVCPQCGGKLNYSISGYNNHIHGKCETIDCLQWMM